MGHLHFPYCPQKCFEHVVHHPKYNIIYNHILALQSDTIPIDVVFLNYHNVI